MKTSLIWSAILIFHCFIIPESMAQDPPAPPTTVPGPPPSAEEIYLEGLKREASRIGLEKEKLMSENAIAKEKLAKELAERRAELEREALKMEEMKQKQAREMEEARLSAERDLAALKAEAEKTTLQMNVAKAKAEIVAAEMRSKESEMRSQISSLVLELEKREKETLAGNFVPSKPKRLPQPFEGDKLVISDRRIALNGLIVPDTADQISERIDYYNNQDEALPIFIVIDNSPGGSVIAGMKILKAMEGSRAPVYVVVKSFAASMAACITTLADKSFAFPNAIILHHQASNIAMGNITQHREELRELEEIWTRLAGPIAKKMGITLDDFMKQMYANISTGDWSEFADQAVKLKWVDHVVQEIQETSVVKNPDLGKAPISSAPAAPAPQPNSDILGTSTAGLYLTERIDERGKPFMLIPPPGAKDYYYLYNPTGYFRVP